MSTSASEPSKSIALWSGIAAGGGNLLALGVVDWLADGFWERFWGAVIVSVIVGGTVYARERLAAEKHR